jgi:hypothetical protein
MRISLKKIWNRIFMPVERKHYESVDDFKSSNNKHIFSANDFVRKLKEARSKGLDEASVKRLYVVALEELPNVSVVELIR